MLARWRIPAGAIFARKAPGARASTHGSFSGRGIMRTELHLPLTTTKSTQQHASTQRQPPQRTPGSRGATPNYRSWTDLPTRDTQARQNASSRAWQMQPSWHRPPPRTRRELHPLCYSLHYAQHPQAVLGSRSRNISRCRHCFATAAQVRWHARRAKFQQQLRAHTTARERSEYSSLQMQTTRPARSLSE